ncbi:single-stranded DNA-binding protein [uncultured Jatrophihabitans sp.]|uniref:single-stranded DNA-binding protein n=1 Tax=uncultured Jatrophihabitans sp. TaxID=1610747 RepID=UPI0035C9C322
MTSTDAPPEADNCVFLRGRLADEPVLRELPSGDLLATFRLTVDRRPGGRVKVDSIDCVSTRVRVHRSVVAAAPGDRLEIRGSLQRRFWRSPAGPTSRYAVDVTTVRVLRPGRRDAG